MYNFVLQLATRRVIISGCGMVGHMETLSTAHNSPRNELWQNCVFLCVPSITQAKSYMDLYSYDTSTCPIDQGTIWIIY